MRVGIGCDFLRFEGERPSAIDAGVVAPAITDALLGAAGLGTDDDPAVRADPFDALTEAVRRLESRNYQVVNVDASVVCERLVLHPESVAERLASILHSRPSDVSTKGASKEGMGWSASGEGVSVMAVASIAQIEDIDALHASIRSGGG